MHYKDAMTETQHALISSQIQSVAFQLDLLKKGSGGTVGWFRALGLKRYARGVNFRGHRYTQSISFCRSIPKHSKAAQDHRKDGMKGKTAQSPSTNAQDCEFRHLAAPPCIANLSQDASSVSGTASCRRQGGRMGNKVGKFNVNLRPEFHLFSLITIPPPDGVDELHTITGRLQGHNIFSFKIFPVKEDPAFGTGQASTSKSPKCRTTMHDTARRATAHSPSLNASVKAAVTVEAEAQSEDDSDGPDLVNEFSGYDMSSISEVSSDGDEEGDD
ncbi:hypothetical protein OF83DRAFT_1154883 [Amylostereum chailletii]|nr:hypothetical protein OF83DRAFT_1154883 [Amylostereum chailletii]